MRLIFTLLCLFMVISSQLFAAPQNNVETEMKLSSRQLSRWKLNTQRIRDQYNNVLYDLRHGNGEFDDNVNLMHSYYSSTPQYQPFSKSILDQMSAYAMTLDKSQDRSEINAALISYNKLVEDHLTNIDVLSFAITMSKIDVRFGDKYFLQKVKDVIIASLLSRTEKTGKRPENAYDISTYGEETIILQDIGGVVKESNLYKVRKKFYNVHDIVLKDGTHTQIYMDVTEPIRNSLKNKALRIKEDKLSIPQR